MLTFEDVAAEVYGLPLDQFTARRNQRAQQARTAGDRKLAEQIKGLRRPTLVAWLGNQLVREHRQQVGPLLDLGQALRDATAEVRGDQLRALSGQQRQVIAALVGQARAIGDASGQPVSPDAARGLEDTLQAVLADPEAAAAFAGGQLVAGLTPPAFGGFPASPTAHRATPAPAAEPAPDHEAARLVQAEADTRAAQADAERAHAALRAATDAVEDADRLARSAAEQVRHLRAQLDAATRAEAEVTTAVPVAGPTATTQTGRPATPSNVCSTPARGSRHSRISKQRQHVEVGHESSNMDRDAVVRAGVDPRRAAQRHRGA